MDEGEWVVEVVWGKEKHKLWINKEESLGRFKQLVCTTVGVPPPEQRLVFKGKLEA